MIHGVNENSLGNRTRVHFDTKSVKARHDGTWRARLARSRRAGGGILSNNHFVPLLTLLVSLFLRRRELDCKRSFSNHARTTRGLQNWTLCTTKHLPTRHRLRPHHRRWGRCRCCRRRRRPGRRRPGRRQPGRRRRRSCGPAAGKNK